MISPCVYHQFAGELCSEWDKIINQTAMKSTSPLKPFPWLNVEVHIHEGRKNLKAPVVVNTKLNFLKEMKSPHSTYLKDIL